MKKKYKIYHTDFKEKLVLMSYANKSTVKLEKEFGLQRGLLTVWRQKHEKSGNENFPADHFFTLREQNEKIQNLEKKINNMEARFQILKAAGPCLNKEVSHVFSFILKNEKKHSISLMCEVLNKNRSFYHKWRRNNPSNKQIRKRIAQQKIIDAFYAAKQLYGSQRITALLQNEGFKICLSTVKKYMKEMGLRCTIKKDGAANIKSHYLNLSKQIL